MFSGLPYSKACVDFRRHQPKCKMVAIKPDVLVSRVLQQIDVDVGITFIEVENYKNIDIIL